MKKGLTHQKTQKLILIFSFQYTQSTTMDLDLLENDDDFEQAILLLSRGTTSSLPLIPESKDDEEEAVVLPVAPPAFVSSEFSWEVPRNGFERSLQDWFNGMFSNLEFIRPLPMVADATIVVVDISVLTFLNHDAVAFLDPEGDCDWRSQFWKMASSSYCGILRPGCLTLLAQLIWAKRANQVGGIMLSGSYYRNPTFVGEFAYFIHQVCHINLFDVWCNFNTAITSECLAIMEENRLDIISFETPKLKAGDKWRKAVLDGPLIEVAPTTWQQYIEMNCDFRLFWSPYCDLGDERPMWRILAMQERLTKPSLRTYSENRMFKASRPRGHSYL